jgi:hypothetical protein
MTRKKTSKLTRDLNQLKGACVCYGDPDPLSTSDTVIPGEVMHDNAVKDAMVKRLFPRYRHAITYEIPVLWHIKIVSVFDHNNGEKDLLIERELEAFGILDHINETAIEQIQETLDEGKQNKLNKYRVTLFYCQIKDLRNKPQTIEQKIKAALAA